MTIKLWLMFGFSLLSLSYLVYYIFLLLKCNPDLLDKVRHYPPETTTIERIKTSIWFGFMTACPIINVIFGFLCLWLSTSKNGQQLLLDSLLELLDDDSDLQK